MFNLSPAELQLLKPLTTPQKIQDFLDKIPINFEEDGETCMSPRMVLREWKAHCIEGALLAALALRVQRHKPLIVDMLSTGDDDDHVIAVFKQHGCWGAISKTNHAAVGYRDPVYKTIRELVMSYFNEYTDKKGKKTLRSYSSPVSLARFDGRGWMVSEKGVWYISDYLDIVKHFPLLRQAQIALLRNADSFERKAGNIVRWEPRRAKI